MDTRRISKPYATTPNAIDDVSSNEPEIIELSAVAANRRGLLARFLFVASVALLAGLIAIAGVPSRSTFALDTSLPNIFSPTAAP